MLSSFIFSFAKATEEFDIDVAGVILLEVAVEGSPAGTEKLIFDTGSEHSWIYHNEELKRIHRGYIPARMIVGGFRTHMISHMSVVPENGRHILYADSSRIQCDKWTRKQFKIGNHAWQQKFGIARGNEKGSPPRNSGLIGASPKSEFALVHPQFGFRPMYSNKMKLFFGPIDPEKCNNNQVQYVRLSDHRHWTIPGSFYFGEGFGARRVSLAFDTGASVLALPHTLFVYIYHRIKRLGIRYEYFHNKLHGEIDCRDVHKLLPFEIHTREGFKIILPVSHYVEKHYPSVCVVLFARISDRLPIVLGRPLIRNFITEYDQTNMRIGICQPAGRDFNVGDQIEEIPYPPIQDMIIPPRLPYGIIVGPFDTYDSLSLSAVFSNIMLLLIVFMH